MRVASPQAPHRQPRDVRLHMRDNKCAMWTVVTAELSELPRRMGGTRGVLTLAVLLVLATFVPARLGIAFLDPVFLLAWTSFAALFTSSFAAQTWAGTTERARLENRPNATAADDANQVWGKTVAGALFGFLCWALLFAAALAAMNAGRPTPLFPRPLAFGAVTGFAAAVSLFTAGVGAVVGLQVFSAQAARQLLRLGFFFLLLILLAGPRLLPAHLQESLRIAVVLRFPQLAAVAGLVLAGISFLCIRHATAMLSDRRHGLSILNAGE